MVNSSRNLCGHDSALLQACGQITRYNDRMLTRALFPSLAASKHSVLLLGPRQTGKSTLMRQLGPDISINLARETTFLDFARNPAELEQRLCAVTSEKTQVVFIDEVQRLPSILNTVQALLDEQPGRFRFLLTGSSARKLRRGGANLLPGRVHTYALGPTIAREHSFRLDTPRALAIGTLPGVWTDPDAASQKKTLRSYAATYVREEIQAESLSRQMEGFARFIGVTAQWSGQFIDMNKWAVAAQVSRQSVARWLEVLEDTLLVRRVGPFAKSATRRLVQHPKLYYFDVGVLNGLLGNLVVSPDRMGSLFEHLVCSQIIDSAAAADKDIRISTFRTEHGAEVDFIVELEGTVWAIEVKAARTISQTDFSGLRQFAEYYGKKHRALVFTLAEDAKHYDDIDSFPWQLGLREMGL